MRSFYKHAQRAIHRPATATYILTADLEPMDIVNTPYGQGTITAIDKLHTRICNGVAVHFYRLYMDGLSIRSIVVVGSQQWSIQ